MKYNVKKRQQNDEQVIIECVLEMMAKMVLSENKKERLICDSGALDWTPKIFDLNDGECG